MVGGGFYGKKNYGKKYNILVIRVNHNGELVNARPCHNCVDMLQSCGIKTIYYSTENGIIGEKVNNIISINSSSVSRLIERTVYNAPLDDTKYYTTLLQNKFPQYIKKINLDNFLTYNIKNVLPYFTWKIIKNKIIFYDNNNNFILTSIIY